jgi:hypothetical protein
MKNCDLTAGAARLDQALRVLQKTRNELADIWDDENFRNVQENYLMPFEVRVKRALEGIKQMAQVLEKAQRDCDE